MVYLQNKHLGDKINLVHLDLDRFDFKEFKIPKFGILIRYGSDVIGVMCHVSYTNIRNMISSDWVFEDSDQTTIRTWAKSHQ